MGEIDDLLDSIFDGNNGALYREFGRWLRESRRFKAFATLYRVKIHAKLRNVRDPEGMKDLWAELETAALLLREERFALEYEKYAAAKLRGPDFTVTFRTRIPFNVEVRRMRSLDVEEVSAETRTGRLIGAMCDKLGQMPPGVVNLLWLASETAMAETELTAATSSLRQLAEHKADDFFTRRGFESAAAFLRQYARLSGVVLRQPRQSVLWQNSLARHQISREVATAIRRLLAV